MKGKSIVILITAFSILLEKGFSQSSFLPKNLGSSVNSSYDEVNPVIAPDGKTLFFTRLNHPDNKLGAKKSAEVWLSILRKNGTCTLAQRIDALNIGRSNAVLSVSGNGNELFLLIDKELHQSVRQGETWGTPQKLNIQASEDAMMSADGKYILFSNGGTINMIEKLENAAWTKPQPLRSLHSKKEMSPYLLADNKTLFFASNHNGKRFDIYKAERLNEGWDTWSQPLALNDTINSIPEKHQFKTNSIGSWLYFSSTSNSLGKADIFRVKIFEDSPYVEVSGKVVNAVTKRPLRNKAFTMLADGKPIDSVTINRDSATYQVKLPFGKTYSLTSDVDHYTSRAYTIDAKALHEYTYIEQNIEEGPVPYVLLKGKMLIKNTDRIIPGRANPAIVVDGERIDSASVNLSKGTYALKINHGAVYYVQVSAKTFESFPSLVDLTSMDGYEEIELDLQADAEKMAIVTGRIIDKKTRDTLLSTIPMRINVEGIESVYASVDSLTGSYDLRLPLHATYTISCSSPGYYPIYETVDVTNNNEEVKILKDLFVVPLEQGQSALLKNIFIASGKTTLLKESFPELDRLVKFLRENPKVKIEIGGYPNKGVTISSLQAANAVVKYVVSKGISSKRLIAKGYSSAKSNFWVTAIPQPMRIEFTILNVN